MSEQVMEFLRSGPFRTALENVSLYAFVTVVAGLISAMPNGSILVVPAILFGIAQAGYTVDRDWGTLQHFEQIFICYMVVWILIFCNPLVAFGFYGGCWATTYLAHVWGIELWKL